MKYIIGICGYKQSGKDTAANILADMFWPNASIIHFADEMKKEIAAAFETTVGAINRNKSHPAVRNSLQFWGQRKKEDNGQLVWIDKLKEVIDQIPDKQFILIPDVRFPFEGEWIKDELKGMVIRVERKGQVNIDPHPSEVEIDKVQPNHFLTNNGQNLRAYQLECKWVAQFIKEFFKLA